MFFAHDPGGANAIFPLMDAFRAFGYDVYAYADGPAKIKIPQAAILHIDEMNHLLSSIKPDFIITGTSANDFTEKFLWRTAEKHRIPAMAVLDHWCNYGVRFSKYGLKDISQYHSDKTFDFLPRFICVMDDFAKAEMQMEGIPPDMIYPMGNPHFAAIKNKSKNVNIEKIRSKFPQEKQMIAFASEPYEEDYGVSPEKKALADVIKILEQIDDAFLVVKLHPKESKDKYREFKNVFFDLETDSQELIMVSDAIISMTSMLLIESCILGKKSISYQPGELDKNKFILTRNGVLPFLNDCEDLKRTLDSLLNAPEIRYNFAVDLNAVDNIIKFVREQLCRN
jgi:hypothetical protein